MTCVVAGKTEVRFFLVSAAELIGTEGGVGADRIHNVDELVRRVAPTVLVIDQLDATGKVRGGAATTSGPGRRWQPLHQLLTEMDRLSGTDGVVVLTAAIRSYRRGSALVQPGRTDPSTTVVAPDLDGRRRILRFYTRSVPMAEDVDLEELAAATPDMVATDLGGLVTEAAFLGAIRDHSRVTRSDFSDALEQLTLGTA